MRRDEFISKVAEATQDVCGVEFKKKDVKTLLEAIELVTVDTVKKEDYVPFSFGKIGGKTRAAREGRNPLTGESISIPEKKGQPYAKFGKQIKE